MQEKIEIIILNIFGIIGQKYSKTDTVIFGKYASRYPAGRIEQRAKRTFAAAAFCTGQRNHITQ